MLDRREKTFVREYFLNKGKAKPAAERAGYAPATACTEAFKWIAHTREESLKPEMWDALQVLIEEAEAEFDMNKGKVINGFLNIAQFDVREIMDDFGDIRPMAEWPDHIARAVAGVEVEENKDPLTGFVATRVKKIKLHNRNEAWGNLAKIMNYNAGDKLTIDASGLFLEMLKKTSGNYKPVEEEKP